MIIKSFTFAVFTERVSLMLTDRLSSTLKQLDYSDTVNFWLPSARWSKLHEKFIFDAGATRRRRCQ